MTDILLIDDDRTALLIYERLIRDRLGEDINLDQCADIKDLSSMLSAKRYAVLILDQRLNDGIEGLALIPNIRRISPSSRIILNSAFGSEMLASRALDAGCDAYVIGRKCDDDNLLDKIEREIDRFNEIQGAVSQLELETNGDLKTICNHLVSKLRKMRGEDIIP